MAIWILKENITEMPLNYDKPMKIILESFYKKGGMVDLNI